MLKMLMITFIIYDQLSSPVEYFVWSFRFSTEYGNQIFTHLLKKLVEEKTKIHRTFLDGKLKLY